MKAGDGNDCLFVYGTLMDAAERARIIGRPIDAMPARLSGYRCGQKDYYFVVKCEGAAVDGAILEGLMARDLKILDEYEEVPALYTRERIIVNARDGRPIECWIYLPGNWAQK
jgi:gamma-glutamylcyclotransferase (GGCT)/AIG2-like uncharacterized protein YtfP